MDLNSFFGQINSNYNSNTTSNSNNNNNSIDNNNSIAHNNNNNNNHLHSIADDTPAILLEQLAYIDTFMPQIEEDIITNNNNHSDQINHNNNLIHNNINNNNNSNNVLNNSLNDFIPTALDDRLAEELKIFADESFIFPDEDKPEYNDQDNNNFNINNNDNGNNFLNINNNNNDIINSLYQRQHSRKDVTAKNFKTPFGKDDNKAFLKRHNNNNNNNNNNNTSRITSPLHQEILPLSFDYISGTNNLHNNNNNNNQQQQQSYTPSVHSIHSGSASNSIVSLPQQTPIPTSYSSQDQLKQKPTNELNTLLPAHLQARYNTILHNLLLEKDKKWGNFSNEEAALLLLFKEHYLAQLPVNLLQYDQFQDLNVVECELYKVMGMRLTNNDNQGINNINNNNSSSSNSKNNNNNGNGIRSGSVTAESKRDETSIGAKRRSSMQEDDLENQVKKLIKISEKLQKKITSLEVENKMLRNLLSKDD